MVIDATFWVAISFVIFVGGLVYLKIPQKINEVLNKLILDIKNEIEEREKLRSEAKILLDNAQKKLDTAQADGNKILELLKYLNKENIAHPVSGINIEFENEKITTIIGGEEFDINKSYYVLTSNYLQEGGDKMNFFKDPIELHELNLNIRDILITNIKKRKSLSSKLDNRIIRN